MNIVERIRFDAASRLSKTALIEGERSFTYGELLAYTDALTATLFGHGVKSLERVALSCPGSIEYVVATLAVLSAGAVIVPVPAGASERETGEILTKIGVHWHISAAKGSNSLAALAAPGAKFTRQLYLERLSPLSEPPSEYSGLNPAFIRFSSGTTGTSKGVVLSHESIIARTDAANEALAMSADDTIVWVLSMAFHFVVTMLLFLRKGVTVVICEEDFPAAFLQAVALYQPTLVYASPFHYEALIASAINARVLRRARLLITTAMAMPLSLGERFVAAFGRQLSQAYGIIEVGLPCVNHAPTEKTRLSVGRPGDDFEIRVREPDADGVGVIMLRGPGMFDAYYAPWQSCSDVLVDGWFDTGDLGLIDVDGYVYLRGRTKHVINFCGMKIFPEEVEQAVNAFPGVQESFVYASPHELFGQVPSVDIVTRGTPVALSDLRRHCYEALATYKVPKEFRFVPAILKTASGKIKRS